MTNELCEELIVLGGREYPVQTNGQHAGARAFFMPYWEGLPSCDHNDRPTSLHVTVYKETSTIPATVTFKVFGGAGGRSTEILVGAVRPEEALDFLPRAEAAGKAMWQAFVTAMTS